MEDYPTRERLAYEAELRRLFANNNEAAQDNDPFNSSKFSGFHQSFSNSSPRYSSSTDSGNAEASSHTSPYQNQRRYSDSFDFNPPFNSSLQEDISTHMTPIRRSPLQETSSFFSDSFSFDSPQNKYTNIPRQNVCDKLFPESIKPSESFVERVNSFQRPNILYSDYNMDNVSGRRFMQNPFAQNALPALPQSLISFAPAYHTPTQNVYFESTGMHNMPVTVHYLPTAVNIPPGAINFEQAVNLPQNSVMSSYSVPISTPVNNMVSTRFVHQHNVTSRLIIPPKVTTSPVVFKILPSSNSSTSSDDVIRKDKICTFCRKNGEAPRIYMTHIVKKKINGKYIATCPILRSHVCAVCGASGDTAHTLTYCPLLKQAGIPLQATTISLKNTKMKSNGKPRH